MGKQTTESRAATTKVHKGYLALGIVLLAIAVLALILAVIPVSASVKLPTENLQSIQVITNDQFAWEGGRAENTVELIEGYDDEKIDDVLEAYQKSTTYSVGYAMMNNLWSYRSFVSEMEPKDVNAIKALSPSGSQKMVVLSYASTQTASLDSEEIEYDRAFVFVSDSDNRLITYSVYLVDSAKVLSGNDTYTVKEYRGWMNGTQWIGVLDSLSE